MQDSSPFLSTLRPAPRTQRIALAVALLSFAVFLVVAPFAQRPLAPVPAFMPMYQSALVVCDLTTAALLFGQFAILRARALLLLASGYWFGALMAVAHALSFPGLFAPGGLMGAGGQTTAWLYFLWHAGFPLFVIGYALLKDEPAAQHEPVKAAEVFRDRERGVDPAVRIGLDLTDLILLNCEAVS